MNGTGPGPLTAALTLVGEILRELDHWVMLVEDDKRDEWRARAEALVARRTADAPDVTAYDLAQKLHAAYWRVVGGEVWAWESEEPEIREGWLAVAGEALAAAAPDGSGQQAGDAAELATLRVLRAITADFAQTWRELLPGLPDSYSCHMTCGEANAAADLYHALGRDDDAQAIISAHIEYDDDDERETHESARAGLEAGGHG